MAHLWFRSAQPWLKLDDGLPVYATQPALSELLEAKRILDRSGARS